MATTTNYSWTTPDDTALVKDGAAAIRSLGTAIDTTTYNNSLLPIVKTIVDAKGDIIAATAADTVSRLAVGANDTVLTADSTAATGLKWAAAGSNPSFTLLNSPSTSLSGSASTTISFTAYNYLAVFITDTSTVSSGVELNFRWNNDTGSNYRLSNVRWEAGTSGYGRSSSGDTSLNIFGNQGAAADTNSACIFLSGGQGSGVKPYEFQGASSGASPSRTYFGRGVYLGSSTITGITIFTSSGNFDAGTVHVYGAN